jgi:uncharacterized protein YcbX
MEATISELNIYPIKGCRGISLESASLGVRGLEFDRNWMVVRELDGRFISQRDKAEMACILVTIDGDSLRLDCEGKDSLVVPLDAATGAERMVTVWEDTCPAVDQGDAAAAWLTDVLGPDSGQSLRLVRFKEDHRRWVDPERVPAGTAHTAFADGFPLLVVNSSSVDELNEKLVQRGKEPVGADRFRANLVVKGLPASIEDQTRKVEIGEDGVQLEFVKPCSRCVVITRDQISGRPGPDPKEPTATLATYRRNGKKILFGQNAVVVAGEGKILRTGDRVKIIERSEKPQ